MWAELVKKTPEGEISLGVVLLENGVLEMDVPANESRDEIEPLFAQGDVTFAWGGYGGRMDPLTYKRMTERWFVAVLNSLPEPYGWCVIDAGPSRPSS